MMKYNRLYIWLSSSRIDFIWS